MDPERKDPSTDGEGQSEASATTAATSAPATQDPKYKGLQQALEAEKTERKRIEQQLAELRGDPSAEEERDSLREELQKLRGELELRDLKSQHPDLTDVIDVAVAEGLKLTPGVIAAIKAKVATKPEETMRPETSGIRNGGSPDKSLSGEEQRFMDILTKGSLF